MLSPLLTFPNFCLSVRLSGRVGPSECVASSIGGQRCGDTARPQARRRQDVDSRQPLHSRLPQVARQPNRVRVDAADYLVTFVFMHHQVHDCGSRLQLRVLGRACRSLHGQWSEGRHHVVPRGCRQGSQEERQRSASHPSRFVVHVSLAHGRRPDSVAPFRNGLRAAARRRHDGHASVLAAGDEVGRRVLRDGAVRRVGVVSADLPSGAARKQPPQDRGGRLGGLVDALVPEGVP